MGKVIVDISMSLDGFVAGSNGGPGNAIGDGAPTPPVDVRRRELARV